MQTASRIAATAKLASRRSAAETRNRAREDIKRVINSVEKVRKWEKRWVMLADSTVSVLKWVPVTNSSSKTSAAAKQPSATAATTIGNTNLKNGIDTSGTNGSSSSSLDGGENATVSDSTTAVPQVAIQNVALVDEERSNDTASINGASSAVRSDYINGSPLAPIPEELPSAEEDVIGMESGADSQSQTLDNAKNEKLPLDAPTDFSGLMRKANCGEKRKASGSNIKDNLTKDNEREPPAKKVHQ